VEVADVTTIGPPAPGSGRRWTRRRRDDRDGSGEGQLGVVGGLAALSLDALSSVAYGPQAMLSVLVLAGAGAVTDVLPVTAVITAMLVLLVISYSQVIAAHPEGGGAYAVAKTSLGRWPSLLAAAAVVVDYVLTVAVSLAAGAASIGSAFPGLANHVVVVSLIALVLLTAVNLFGIEESARLLMLPAAVFVLSTLAVIVVAAFHSHPVATIGSPQRFPAVEALGILLLLKAFASGCSAVTGVEAISNAVPSFREPRVKSAQRTEISLGFLLAVLLLGLAAEISAHHVVPRGNVTVLAQLTAWGFGKSWAFYVSNLSVVVVLGFAANTSFGGLPVLMNLLARDHRLPHMFYLRAEKPVYRYGIVTLAILAAALILATGADTLRLIPLYAIGVFVGFTISQIGLVVHWRGERPRRWQLRATLNGAGAIMTGAAVLIFLISKFLEGAWVVIVAIPVLIYLFWSTEHYYDEVAHELKLGRTPPPPHQRESVVVVPTTTVSLLTERALSAALSLGDTVVAVAVAGDQEECDRIKHQWDEWKSGVPIEVLIDPHRSLIRTVLEYVRSVESDELQITVLIPELLPRKRRHEILHNQRGRLLAAVLKARTNVVVASLPFHLHE
jgi:amino acid transporter